MLPRFGALVVGLGGVTNGGKTTLCQTLHRRFCGEAVRVKTLHIDHYYRSEGDPEQIYLTKYQHHDWDCLNALDIDRFLRDLRTMRDQCDLLLVEGCLIFNIPSLQDETFFHLSYYFDLPYDECRQRRTDRRYDPPDVDGYFEEHVWPAFLQAKVTVLTSNRPVGLKVIDTSKETFQRVEESIVRDIESALKVLPPASATSDFS